MMRLLALIAVLAPLAAMAQPGSAAPGTSTTLPGTTPLEGTHDFAAEMVAGIDGWLDRLTETRKGQRAQYWKRDVASPEAYTASVEPNRERLREILGVVEPRVAPAPEGAGPLGVGDVIASGPGYTVQAVRWQVLDGLTAEGLLLQPRGGASLTIIALPDCDVTPEALCGLAPGLPEPAQYARRLAEQGLRVLVPVLIDRADTHSGHPAARFTNQPHREFIYRAAFELGRHVIGYEIQKLQSAMDWLGALPGAGPVGIIGHGEGGLLAFYTAAVDTRVAATAVSGYFGPREMLWREPIYRNVFGLLREFGDAEVATLIAPRALVVEASRAPEITGPPAPREGRIGAAPGIIATPGPSEAQAELTRARVLIGDLQPPPALQLVPSVDGLPGSDATLKAFLIALGGDFAAHPMPAPVPGPASIDPAARQQRQVAEMVEHVQAQLREAPYTRAKFWQKADATSPETWTASTQFYRDYLWDEIIGRLPAADTPANPRTRQIYDTPAYTGYEVQLNVYNGVFAYGILLVPKGIAAGEKRPVVVCQHGLEGRPNLVTEETPGDPYYNHFGAQLATKGYIVFAPQNPYIGEDKFRVLQRKLNPLKLTLFSVITRQHERVLEWLGTLPQVDPARIGFYGLSYGGKTAMRVPALLTNYAFSICSADYNEWIWKNASARSPYSYLFTGEYEIFEWNLGNTFNYAELSWLICPRPFMVERGHQDGVAPDEWVGYEFARTRQRYDQLGLGDKAQLEVFNGPHTIHGVGTFAFIDQLFSAPHGN